MPDTNRRSKRNPKHPPSRSTAPAEEEAWFDDFGNPTAIDDLARSHGHVDVFFTETSEIRRFLKDNPAAPFIVGAKGTGKSLLLFKKLVAARSLQGVVVLPDGPRKAFMPATSFATLTEVNEMWPLTKNGQPNSELWSLLWEWALLKTVVAGWYRHRASARHKHEPSAALAALVGKDINADPYDLIESLLISALEGHRNVRGRMKPPATIELRQYVVNHSATHPPTFFFLDNHDETFERSPAIWISSCIGAFKAINQIHQWTNRRIHGFLTLRTEVIRELQHSQQYPQWSANFFRLLWGDDKLVEMFRRRASRLRPELLRAPTLREKNPLAAFLGAELLDVNDELKIRNPAVETAAHIDEAMESYILRHTLRRPRDLIVLGNQLISALRPGTPTEMMPTLIRNAIDKARSTVGEGYLAEIASQWPWANTPGGEISTFIGKYIRRNILSAAAVKRINDDFLASEAGAAHKSMPIDILIRLGLIGYPVHNENDSRLVQHFLRVGDEDEPPQGYIEWYFVHPVLYGKPLHIQPVLGQVIGPNLPFDPSLVNLDDEVNIKISTSTTFNWLHLSDLHFGHGSPGHQMDQRLVLDRLLDDASACVGHGHPRPNAIFITGDVAFSGNCRSAHEYEWACAWINELARRMNVPAERIFIVPGNHDVSRRVDVIHSGPWFILKALRDNKTYNLDKAWAVESSQAHLLARQEAFLRFAASYGPHLTRQATIADPFWKHRIELPGGAGICILGLNTALLSGDERDLDDDRGRLCIGKTQMAAMVPSEKAAPGELTIILSHHPFVQGWLADERDVSAWAQQRAGLHLCGHVHDSDARQVVQGGGGRLLTLTAGASHEDEDPSAVARHGYSFTSIAWESGRPVRLTNWPRRWSTKLHSFVLDVDNVPNHGHFAAFPLGL